MSVRTAEVKQFFIQVIFYSNNYVEKIRHFGLNFHKRGVVIGVRGMQSCSSDASGKLKNKFATLANRRKGRLLSRYGT